MIFCDYQDLITDGIREGQLPLLQSFLRDRSGSQTSVLKYVVDCGLQKALDYLKQKQMKEAGQMLANMV